MFPASFVPESTSYRQVPQTTPSMPTVPPLFGRSFIYDSSFNDLRESEMWLPGDHCKHNFSQICVHLHELGQYLHEHCNLGDVALVKTTAVQAVGGSVASHWYLQLHDKDAFANEPYMRDVMRCYVLQQVKRAGGPDYIDYHTLEGAYQLGFKVLSNGWSCTLGPRITVQFLEADPEDITWKVSLIWGWGVCRGIYSIETLEDALSEVRRREFCASHLQQPLMPLLQALSDGSLVSPDDWQSAQEQLARMSLKELNELWVDFQRSRHDSQRAMWIDSLNILLLAKDNSEALKNLTRMFWKRQNIADFGDGRLFIQLIHDHPPKVPHLLSWFYCAVLYTFVQPFAHNIQAWNFPFAKKFNSRSFAAFSGEPQPRHLAFRGPPQNSLPSHIATEFCQSIPHLQDVDTTVFRPILSALGLIDITLLSPAAVIRGIVDEWPGDRLRPILQHACARYPQVPDNLATWLQKQESQPLQATVNRAKKLSVGSRNQQLVQQIRILQRGLLPMPQVPGECQEERKFPFVCSADSTDVVALHRFSKDCGQPSPVLAPLSVECLGSAVNVPDQVLRPLTIAESSPAQLPEVTQAELQETEAKRAQKLTVRQMAKKVNAVSPELNPAYQIQKWFEGARNETTHDPHRWQEIAIQMLEGWPGVQSILEKSPDQKNMVINDFISVLVRSDLLSHLQLALILAVKDNPDLAPATKNALLMSLGRRLPEIGVWPDKLMNRATACIDRLMQSPLEPEVVDCLSLSLRCFAQANLHQLAFIPFRSSNSALSSLSVQKKEELALKGLFAAIDKANVPAALDYITWIQKNLPEASRSQVVPSIIAHLDEKLFLPISQPEAGGNTLNDLIKSAREWVPIYFAADFRAAANFVYRLTAESVAKKPGDVITESLLPVYQLADDLGVDLRADPENRRNYCIVLITKICDSHSHTNTAKFDDWLIELRTITNFEDPREVYSVYLAHDHHMKRLLQQSIRRSMNKKDHYSMVALDQYVMDHWKPYMQKCVIDDIDRAFSDAHLAAMGLLYTPFYCMALNEACKQTKKPITEYKFAEDEHDVDILPNIVSKKVPDYDTLQKGERLEALDTALTLMRASPEKISAMISFKFIEALAPLVMRFVQLEEELIGEKVTQLLNVKADDDTKRTWLTQQRQKVAYSHILLGFLVCHIIRCWANTPTIERFRGTLKLVQIKAEAHMLRLSRNLDDDKGN